MQGPSTSPCVPLRHLLLLFLCVSTAVPEAAASHASSRHLGRLFRIRSISHAASSSDAAARTVDDTHVHLPQPAGASIQITVGCCDKGTGSGGADHEALNPSSPPSSPSPTPESSTSMVCNPSIRKPCHGFSNQHLQTPFQHASSEKDCLLAGCCWVPTLHVHVPYTPCFEKSSKEDSPNYNNGNILQQ